MHVCCFSTSVFWTRVYHKPLKLSIKTSNSFKPVQEMGILDLTGGNSQYDTLRCKRRVRRFCSFLLSQPQYCSFRGHILLPCKNCLAGHISSALTKILSLPGSKPRTWAAAGGSSWEPPAQPHWLVPRPSRPCSPPAIVGPLTGRT